RAAFGKDQGAGGHLGHRSRGKAIGQLILRRLLDMFDYRELGWNSRRLQSKPQLHLQCVSHAEKCRGVTASTVSSAASLTAVAAHRCHRRDRVYEVEGI